MSSSLLGRALGQAKREGGENRRSSGGGQRGSPYARNDNAGGDKGAKGGQWGHDGFAESQKAPEPRAAPAGSLAARLGGAPAAGGAAKGTTTKLVIKNLHYEVSERELELLFVQIGPLANGPKIKFDRSGRSEGIAWVSYESAAHAVEAQKAFNGAPAKGQPIEIDFDYSRDRVERPVPGAPAPGSLLARLNPDTNAPRGPRTGGAQPTNSRPARGRAERGVGGAPSGPRGGRGGAGGRGGGRGGEPRQKREPKTNDDLDAELEAFMKAPPAEGSAKPTEVAPPVSAAGTGDVEMS